MLRHVVVSAGTALVASFVLGGSAAAQTGVLSGTVSAGSGKVALEGATVTIIGTKLSAVTDKDGRFTIAGVAAGDHDLQVRRFQFIPLNDRVRIAANDTTRARYTLIDPNDPEARQLERIGDGVTGGRTVRTVDDPSIHVLTPSALTEARRSENAPIYILDGVILPIDFNVKDIEQTSIETVEVLRNTVAIQKYGERGANGAIIITTKAKTRPPLN